MLHVREGRPTPRGYRGPRSACTFPPVPTIVLNGASRPLAAPMTVADLVAELGLDARQIAVERNREIVPRAQYSATPLADGDHLEIVTFVGGG